MCWPAPVVPGTSPGTWGTEVVSGFPDQMGQVHGVEAVGRVSL